MMNQTSPERVRQDSRLIGQTLLKLALPRLLLRAIVIAVALIIWYFVANWILDAGKRVSFEFLHSLGQPTMDMVQKFSPYLWWVGVGIWSLIVFFALRAWLSASLASGRATPVQTEVLAELAPQLSDESLGVLRWTWGDREEPFTVGDLRRSLSEIRHSRIAKIDMVARQAEILEGGGKPRAGSATTTPAPRTARRPLRRAAHRPRPISDTLPRNRQKPPSRRLLHFSALPASRSYTGLPRSRNRGPRVIPTPCAGGPPRRPRGRPPGVRFPCSVLPSGSPPAWRWPARPPFRSARRRGCLARQAHHLRRPVHRRRRHDLVARIIAKAVGAALNQPVIVENRPGAGGVIGAAHVARSPADGYTYLVGSNGTVTNSLIRSDQPYKDEALTPVALLSITPSVIVTHPSNPAKDLKDFVARAKQAKTDRITFSTAGNGSTHFVAEMLKEASGLPVEPIAYKSGSEGVSAVIGNQVDATSEASIVTLPLVQSGKLKALATTWDKRMASAPDIPTTAEAGFGTVRIGHWAGLYAPTGTPADVLDKMNAAVEQSLQTREVQDALRQSSIEPGGGSRASFAEFAANERKRLGEVVKNGHMQTQ